jgi:hypothetical protein
LAEKRWGNDETKAAIDWAQTSGTWKLSAGGWMRELELSAAESHQMWHLLGYYARAVWAHIKKKARKELKKRQER